MKPLPDNLPPLPDGYVYLGTGLSFKVGENFAGLYCRDGQWIEGDNFSGRWDRYHYAAPSGSEIARLNAEPERPRIEIKPTHIERCSKREVIVHTTDGPNPGHPIVGSIKWPDGIWAACSFKDSDLIELREPREWWVNIDYDGLEFFYTTKEEADQDRNEDHKECILVREVREEGA